MRFVDATHRWLRRVVARELRDAPGDVDDIVQETLLRAWVKWAELDEPRRWVRKVAHDLAIDRRRKAGPRREQLTSTFPDDALGASPSCCDAYTADEDLARARAHVRRALSELPEDRRRLVLARELDRVPYAELARSFGTSEIALRAQKRRTLDSLARRITQLSSMASVMPLLGRFVPRRLRDAGTVPAGMTMASVAVVAVTVTGGPFGAHVAPLPVRTAPASVGWQQPRHPAADSPGSANDRARRVPRAATPESRATVTGAEPAGTRRELPVNGHRVCVGTACVAGGTPGNGARDVITVDLPDALPDVVVVQDHAPLCRHLPDGVPGVACRTEGGDPQYLASPPPPPQPS